jgi:hypothetical protein
MMKSKTSLTNCPISRASKRCAFMTVKATVMAYVNHS